jgi:hypothetical protein
MKKVRGAPCFSVLLHGRHSLNNTSGLRLASNLLRVGHDDLKAALTSRLIDVGKERMFKPLLREEVRTRCPHRVIVRCCSDVPHSSIWL